MNYKAFLYRLEKFGVKDDDFSREGG
jgi:hypothetical protein